MQNAFVRFQMKAYLFYHAQQALSRTFLTFFEAFQLQTSFSQFFRNFLSRFAILPDSLFIIPHPDSLVNIFFHPLSSFFCPRRRPSRCSLISIRHSHPLVNSFFCFSTSFFAGRHPTRRVNRNASNTCPFYLCFFRKTCSLPRNTPPAGSLHAPAHELFLHSLRAHRSRRCVC